MHSFIKGNPVLIALGLVVIYFLIFAVPALDTSTRFGHGHGVEDAKGAAGQLGLELFLALSILAAILVLGWAKSARLTTPPHWRALVILIPPLLYIGILFWAKIAGGGLGFGTVLAMPVIQSMILVTLLVGVFEELLFRGAVFQSFEFRFGVTVAFFVSSLLFGVMHYVNWIGGQPFTSTSLQVIHAAGSGLMYAAIMLITRSIWFSVAFHALWDCSVFLMGVMGADVAVDGVASDGGSGDVLQTFLLLGLEPIYGLLLFWWWRRSTKVCPTDQEPPNPSLARPEI